MLITWLQFTAGALIIVIAGITLTKNAEILAKKFGLGAGWAGLLILPLATSLPELTSSARAVLINAPDLAAGNLFGSNLFNLALIALIDLIQGRGALLYRLKDGHPMAASLGVVLISIAGLGLIVPFPALFGTWVGLDTILLIACYVAAAKLLTSYEQRSRPVSNLNGLMNAPGTAGDEIRLTAPSPKRALLYFLAAAGVILIAGTYLTDAADVIAYETGLGRTFVGTILLAVATSLPEVVTTSTAARMGKFDMAVGNVFGANMFNMLILALVDILYMPGSLLKAISTGHLLVVLMVVILTALAITGLVHRSQKAVGLFGIDSYIIIFGYLAAAFVLFYMRVG